MNKKFDGSFYCEGKKIYYRVVKECCISLEECECDIEYFDENDNSFIISKLGFCTELGVIDPIKAKHYYEGENNGK